VNKNLKINEKTKLEGIVSFIYRNVLTGKVLRVNTYCNSIANSFKSMIAERLAQGSNTCDITYVAVGTGTSAFDPTDTTLDTELARSAIGSGSISSSANVVSITGFFGASEANGVLSEIAWFGQSASATPDSGTMVNRAVISEEKTISETLTIEGTITIS